MTQVSSSPFTVQIVVAGNPYSGYTVGQCTKVYTGSTSAQSALTEPNFGVLSFSGMAYDSSAGNIFLHGGGHEINDNSVWRFNVVTATWSRDYAADHQSYPNPPDTPAALQADVNWATYPGMWLSTGRPISRHTRYSMTWLSHLSKFCSSGGSLWGGIGLGLDLWPGDGEETWLYDPVAPLASRWSWRGSTLLNSSYLRPSSAMYSSTRQRVYTDAAKVNNRLPIAEWNAGTNTWANHWNGSDASVLFPQATPYDINYQLLAIDDSGDRIFAVTAGSGGAFRVGVYGLASRTWTELATTSNPRVPAEGDTLLWSSGTGRLTYVLGDGAAYWLDLSTNAWNTWANHPTGCGQILGARSYCPVRGVAFFVVKNISTSGVDVWAAKY